ncbi:NAD(P)H-dependent oxidoreductase [Lactococcus insecticola]|uniref:NAD(P)H dehydrogenase n=1 Tax=Pseudolactococcus insecticola TaxID=2709158 RepID=A0A6A0B8E0_9LACT|nr:NAD(P)H-dependent oxidoreductase [Lactococcus insecticola]GFH40087.1 NAD(P)H dehydrogenase [Lactococcus insecticola]
MTNILLILDHPYTATSWENIPHERSYSAKITHDISNKARSLGNTIDLIDLHADHFNPVMSKAELQTWRVRGEGDAQVKDYQNRIKNADEIWFIMPMWWELMPAMTKGFIDRVFTKQFLLGDQSQDGKRQVQLKKLQTVHLVTVQGTPKFAYRLLYKNAITNALFKGTFRKMGFRGKLKWHVINGDASDIKREKSLGKLLKFVK